MAAALRLLARCPRSVVRARARAHAPRRGLAAGPVNGTDTIFNEDHVAMRESLAKLIEREINPHVDDWERAAAKDPYNHYPGKARARARFFKNSSCFACQVNSRAVAAVAR